MTCYLVLGTGRSGTSLAMQALAALGIAIPGEQVPASENNLRGTGEAIAFRDQCRNVHQASGLFAGFRPEGWMETPAADTARKWLAGFLTRAIADADGPIALKFPLSGLFLPLWQQAAQEAGCRMRLIWATRGAGQVVRSLVSAYGTPPLRAAQVWAQRSYYLLHDAPDDTLLLPFEGWAVDASAQIAALAGMTGATNADSARAEAQFSARLDHSATPAASMREDVQTVAVAVDSMLAGKRGQLGEVIARDDRASLATMVALADLVAALAPREPFSMDMVEMRLRLLARMDETGDRSAEMDQELNILSDRIKSLAAENRTLRKQPAPVQAAGPHEATARLAERQAEIEHLAAALHDMEAKLSLTQEHLAAEVEKAGALQVAYQDLAGQRDRLEEETEGRYRQRLNVADRRDVNQTKRIEQFIAMRDRLNKRVAALEAENSQLKTRREALVKRVGILEEQVKGLNGQRERLQERIGVLGGTVPDAGIETLGTVGETPAAGTGTPADAGEGLALAPLDIQDLTARLHAAEAANAAFLNSRSWRITRPLRAARAMLRRNTTP